MLHFVSTGPQAAGSEAGPLVVLLHGAGVSAWMWTSITERLPDFATHAVDLPGHGDSRAIAWRSLEDAASEVARVIDREAAGRHVHLVGLSLGAVVALTLVAEGRSAIASATLSGMHAGAMPNRMFVKLVTRLLVPFCPTPFFSRQTAKMIKVPKDDIPRFVSEAGKACGRDVVQACLDVVDYNAPVSLRTVETPTLFLAGGKEHPHILASLGRLAGMMPNARAAIAPGLGHGWSREDPDLFAAAIRARVTGGPLPDGLRPVEGIDQK
ncbi:MAG: alpha/beta hydrolase [Pseudomonadota bacterium]